MLDVLAILCGLAVVAFGAAGRSSPGVAAGGLVFGFAAAWLLAVRPGYAVDPALIATGIALAAGLLLWRAHAALAAGICCGLAAAVWYGVLQARGAPGPAASALALAAAAASLGLSARRAAFAPQALRDEALALVTVLGLGVAAAPAIGAGFRSALALRPGTVQADFSVGPAVPLALALACVLLGGLYALWKRR